MWNELIGGHDFDNRNQFIITRGKCVNVKGMGERERLEKCDKNKLWKRRGEQNEWWCVCVCVFFL